MGESSSIPAASYCGALSYSPGSRCVIVWYLLTAHTRLRGRRAVEVPGRVLDLFPLVGWRLIRPTSPTTDSITSQNHTTLDLSSKQMPTTSLCASQNLPSSFQEIQRSRQDPLLGPSSQPPQSV